MRVCIPACTRSDIISASCIWYHTCKLLGAWDTLKNSGSHIDASLSRQPLVKGERLVRHEVNAVMLEHGSLQQCKVTSHISYSSLCGNVFCSKTAGSENRLLPQRVCCPQRCAMPVQHAKVSEQAQEDTSPVKNICDKQVSSWRHISCHTDKNRYYTWS